MNEIKLEQISLEIIRNFNFLREKYGNLLINLHKEKINPSEWSSFISDKFTDKEISFLFGINIHEYVKDKFNMNLKNINIDVGSHSRIAIEDNSSRLLISQQKVAILIWICTDGYLEISKRGYYVRIRDEEKGLLEHFAKLIRDVYGNTQISITKIKNKNAYELRICSKNIVLDIVTYIPLPTTREWSIPQEFLDEEGIKAVLRILTQTEGSIFCQNRTRMIEITLANLEALTQAKYLFEKLRITTKDIRKDCSGGHERYKLGISTKENLEKFDEIIGFIPGTKKYYKLKELLVNYKQNHKINIDAEIIEIIKKHKSIVTKDIIRLGNFDRTTVSRNLKRLKILEKIDYNTQGKTKIWFIRN